jgi:uncharacterized membrane protein HdeD (DUF308 family)
MSRDYDDDDYEDDEEDDRDRRRAPEDDGEAAALSRINAPSILLIICGVLNLLAALYMVANVAYTATRSPDEIAAQEEMGQDIAAKMFPGAKEELEKERQKQKKSPEAAKTQAMVINGGLLVAWLVTSILPLVAGIRMRSLRGYGLAVTGAIVTAIPCLSPSSCLCGVGMIFGIWALVVLLNAEVKSAFR